MTDCSFCPQDGRDERLLVRGQADACPPALREPRYRAPESQSAFHNNAGVPARNSVSCKGWRAHVRFRISFLTWLT